MKKKITGFYDPRKFVILDCFTCHNEFVESRIAFMVNRLKGRRSFCSSYCLSVWKAKIKKKSQLLRKLMKWRRRRNGKITKNTIPYYGRPPRMKKQKIVLREL